MRKKGLFPLILGSLLLTVFALSAFAPGLFTGYGQKELFTKWLPISREHLPGTNAMGYGYFYRACLWHTAGAACRRLEQYSDADFGGGYRDPWDFSWLGGSAFQ